MIDLIIREPTVSMAELGTLFGYSAGWVSRVVASDAFQARLEQRKAKLVDPHVAQSLNERLTGVVIHSVDLISQKLGDEQSAAFAMDALGVASAALGMGKPARRG